MTQRTKSFRFRIVEDSRRRTRPHEDPETVAQARALSDGKTIFIPGVKGLSETKLRPIFRGQSVRLRSKKDTESGEAGLTVWIEEDNRA